MQAKPTRADFNRAMLVQLIRYGLVGAAITFLGVVIYYGCAEYLGVRPLLANLIAFVTGVAVGYVAHSRISFVGHGAEREVGKTGTRFVVVNLVGLAANSLWVWSLVERGGGPNWWPVVPMVVVTPLLTFWLHRRWTFG